MFNKSGFKKKLVAGFVEAGDVGIELVELEHFATIVDEGFECLGAIALLLPVFCDDDAHFGALVAWVEVHQIHYAHGFSEVVFNDLPQLAVGKDVVSSVGNEVAEGIT